MRVRNLVFCAPAQALGPLRRLTLQRSLASAASQTTSAQTIALPKLGYKYNALEPAISGAIMQLHYEKHHAAYVAGAQKAASDFASGLASGKHDICVAASALIRFHMGGHINHCLFWDNLAPPNSATVGNDAAKRSKLAGLLERDLGGVDNAVALVNAAGLGVQGSGWAWLGYDPRADRLQVATTANQDTLASKTNLVPLLGIDVWEHAYYLDYKNARAEYLAKIWKVINWDAAEKRMVEAKAKSSSK